jgi:hypothetical protein
VEAALDDVNLQRFLGLVHEFREGAQLIIVSHQKRTMEAADALYGVTMAPGGSSKVISQKVPRHRADGVGDGEGGRDGVGDGEGGRDGTPESVEGLERRDGSPAVGVEKGVVLGDVLPQAASGEVRFTDPGPIVTTSSSSVPPYRAESDQRVEDDANGGGQVPDERIDAEPVRGTDQ